MAKEKKKEG